MRGVVLPFLSPDKCGIGGPERKNNSQLASEKPGEIPAWSEPVEKAHKAWSDCPPTFQWGLILAA